MNSDLLQGFVQNSYFLQILSILLLIEVINLTLGQKFKIASFEEMTKPFYNIPINNFYTKNIPMEYFKILTSIEDRTYFERKSYTYLSLNALKCVIEKRVGRRGNISQKAKVTAKAGWLFVKNTVNKKRGYSTI